MFRMGQYVDQAIKSLNAQKAIEFHRLKEAWLQAVGPILAGQAEPTRIRGSVLYVTVSSPAWSQEIQMQQRLILSRLQKTLRQAPAKIVCWVGQPHQGDAPRSRKTRASTDNRAPWANLEIPPQRQAIIEETLAGLAEEAQRLKLRPLIELSVRRELHFLALGQLPCPICGTMRPAEDERCFDCYKEQVAEGERKLMRLMARKPWMKIRDLQDLAPWATRSQVLRLRKTLHSNLLMQAWQLSEGCEGPELAAKMTPGYRKLLSTIAMLRCYLPPTSMRPQHYTFALGKRLGQAMLAHETDQQDD